MTTQLQKSLQAYGEKMADEYELSTTHKCRGYECCYSGTETENNYKTGFNQAIELMLPLLDGVEMGAFHHPACGHYRSDECHCARKKITEALADLRKKVGME